MERMTKASLTAVAETLDQQRRTQIGDGVRAPERGGLGLFDAGTRRQLLAEQARAARLKPRLKLKTPPDEPA